VQIQLDLAVLLKQVTVKLVNQNNLKLKDLNLLKVLLKEHLHVLHSHLQVELADQDQQVYNNHKIGVLNLIVVPELLKDNRVHLGVLVELPHVLLVEDRQELVMQMILNKLVKLLRMD
jgi:hypothetical protein